MRSVKNNSVSPKLTTSINKNLVDMVRERTLSYLKESKTAMKAEDDGIDTSIFTVKARDKWYDTGLKFLNRVPKLQKIQNEKA